MGLNKFRRYASILRREGISCFFIFPALIGVIITAVLESGFILLLMPLVKAAIFSDNTQVREIVDRFHCGSFVNGFHNETLGLFVFIFALIFITGIALGCFSFFSSFVIARNVAEIAHKIRTILIKKYFSFDKSFFDKASNSSAVTIVNQFTNDIAVRMPSITNGLFNASFIVVYLAIIFFISWQLSIVAMLFLPLMQVSVKFLLTGIKKRSVELAELSKGINKKTMEIFSGLTLIRSCDMENHEIGLYAKESEKIRNKTINFSKKKSIILPFREFFQMTMILVLVAIIVCISRYHHVEDPAKYILFFVVIRRMGTRWGGVTQMQTIFNEIVGRIGHIEDVLMDNKSTADVVSGKMQFDLLKKGIEFRNMYFGYTKNIFVLNGLDLFIPVKKTTAIIGPSGVGKTTIANLLMRFYGVSEGSLFFDDVDVGKINTKSIRNGISYVSQESFLFDDSLRYNLLYGIGREIGDEELEYYLKKVKLYDLMKSMEKGLDARVGERGLKLSGGEKQRVSILRAMLRKAEIIILDEATSSLDSITENVLHDYIFNETKGKTVVIIAHRLSTLKNADKIVVLGDGKVREEGTIEELLSLNGLFCEYWNRQNA